MSADANGRAHPPGRVFHAVLIACSLVILWAVSHPGIGLMPFAAAALAALVLMVAAVVWLVRLVRYRRAHGVQARSFAAAPVAAVVVLGLVSTGVPLELRFTLSRGAFENQVKRLQEAPSQEAADRLQMPSRVGLYGVVAAARVPAGVLFWESNGAPIFDDAGFAYLPGGLTGVDEAVPLESPRFRHVSGDWYAWTASW